MAKLRVQKELAEIEKYKAKGYTIATMDLFHEDRFGLITRIKQEGTYYPPYSVVKALHNNEIQLPSRGAADE